MAAAPASAAYTGPALSLGRDFDAVEDLAGTLAEAMEDGFARDADILHCACHLTSMLRTVRVEIARQV